MGHLIRIASGIVVFFILYSIPVLHIKTPVSVNPVYFYDAQKHDTLRTTLPTLSRSYIYHTPLSKDINSSHQYKVTKLDKQGSPLFSFEAPAAKDVTSVHETSYLLNKDGYVTYPQDGSFFLWYPKLGNHIFFYDQEGKFLWSRRNSHYLRAFPSGKYILAMVGDQSRAFIMLPDLSVIGSIEGSLLINYAFSDSPNPKSPWQLCLGFLDGDVVYFDPLQKKDSRVNTGSVTKSIACSFENSFLAVHMENPDPKSQTDVLGLAELKPDGDQLKLKWEFQRPLPQRYPERLPLGIQDNFGVILLPDKGNLQALIFDYSGNISDSSPIELDGSIEDWRIYRLAHGLVAWSSERLVIFYPQKVFEKKMHIENVTVEGSDLYVEGSNGILALEIAE